jgi:CRP-like cAMP-binding protein
MSFRLKEAVYRIRCREPGCTFTSEFKVRENFMGVTEADVDSEAIKIAKNMAFIKHDALLGRKHQLANPEIFKVSSSYDRTGGLTADSVFSQQAEAKQAVPGRAFRKGDLIMKKDENSALVIEVLRGSIQNAGYPGLRYRPGAMVGSASVFHQKSRPADIVAADDDTAVTVHDVRELTHSNPARARELYDRALEEVFSVLVHIGDTCVSLQKKVKKLESLRTSAKPPHPTVAKRRAPAPRKPAARPRAAKRRPAAKGRRA